jgi:hypothetical protein
MQSITENLDDPNFCRAVVLSLRTRLIVTENVAVSLPSLLKIAYGKDASTKAFIELENME